MLACIRALQAVPLIGILHLVPIVGVEGKPQAGPASETLTRVESPLQLCVTRHNLGVTDY
jgi:hypothetical protein